MKTLKNFIDSVASVWPKAEESEKDMLCEAILSGSVFAINSAIKNIVKNIKKREKHNEN